MIGETLADVFSRTPVDVRRVGHSVNAQAVQTVLFHAPDGDIVHIQLPFGKIIVENEGRAAFAVFPESGQVLKLFCARIDLFAVPAFIEHSSVGHDILKNAYSGVMRGIDECAVVVGSSSAHGKCAVVNRGVKIILDGEDVIKSAAQIPDMRKIDVFELQESASSLRNASDSSIWMRAVYGCAFEPCRTLCGEAFPLFLQKFMEIPHGRFEFSRNNFEDEITELLNGAGIDPPHGAAVSSDLESRRAFNGSAGDRVAVVRLKIRILQNGPAGRDFRKKKRPPALRCAADENVAFPIFRESSCRNLDAGFFREFQKRGTL